MSAASDEAPGAVRIAILVFTDAEELDWVGPFEVLTTWASRDPRVSVTLVSDDPTPVRGAKGLRVVPDGTLEDLGDVEVLVIPGGRGTDALVADEPLLATLRDRHRSDTLLVSVCTGALVLAAAGLLADRPATTYWAALEELSALEPTATVRGDARFVDDGDVVTASGVSAGIDVALHLVARLASPELARTVRRAIQYDPQPPV
ncbi:MAG: DJ-1/PfpI family protein [Nitriliruptoraceae bacterium]|nr:DJ-1/PfpI family protein [Nitriliruptoraceae bacterium]